MSGSLRQSWDYFGADVWAPLNEYSVGPDLAPPELFYDLYVAADEFLSPQLTEMLLGEARNSPELARSRFLLLKGTDFASESAIVHFLEKTHDVLADYELTGLTDLYRRLILNVLGKFNLRYRLDAPFTLRFLLPGSFTNLYAELSRLNGVDANLEALWSDFEAAFDQFARSQNDLDLRTCIARASNYLEGLASATHGTPGTLGRLCDNLSDWPHDDVKKAVKSLYGFCSDYPGIRHAGTPGNKRRVLDNRDSVAINVSLMAFAAYLGTGIDQGAILGSGPSQVARRRTNTQVPANTKISTGWFKGLLAKIGL